METKHTPFRELKMVRNENGLLLQFAEGGMNTIADFRDYPGIDGHAENIVRAVNAHEELLDAAKAALKVIDTMSGADRLGLRLSQAIAKAEAK